ncbi:MAG: DUF2938 domain-containing protein [Actinomycetota bacterium]|nr:DUF2938 domain-containing protein [Actinomycetota bacterium]
MDLAGEALRRATGVEPLDYRLVGRWVGHMSQRRFHHESIHAAEPIPGEGTLGWVAHYSIGTGFAIVLEAVRPGWTAHPRLGPALVTGLLTTAAPWLVMQPAFGMGVAASRTPTPWVARWRSARTHAIYGAGLYLTARALRWVCPVDG